MNTSWKELKYTLLDLYKRCYEFDKKYRDYLESNRRLQTLEEYYHSFSEQKPAPYIILEHIKYLSEGGNGKYDRQIL